MNIVGADVEPDAITMMAVERRALDGSLVRMETPERHVDLSQQFISVRSFHLGSHIQEFVAGALRNGRAIAEELGIELAEEFKYRGGDLLVGVASQTDPVSKLEQVTRLGVWEGVRYSLKTSVYNGATTQDLIGVLESVDLSETEEGLIVVPANEQVTDDESRPTLVVQNIPNLGLLEVQALGSALRALPEWSGLEVTGGELFVDGDDMTPSGRTFILAGGGALSQLYPNRWEVEEDTALDRFSHMSIEWQHP